MECHIPQTLVCLWPLLTITYDLLDWSLVVTMLNLGRTPCQTPVWPGRGGEKRGELVPKDHDMHWTLDLYFDLFEGQTFLGMEDHYYQVWMDIPLAYLLPCLIPLGFPDTFINKLKYLRCLCGIPGEWDQLQKDLKVSFKRPFLSLKAWCSSLVILILLTDFCVSSRI